MSGQLRDLASLSMDERRQIAADFINECSQAEMARLASQIEAKQSILKKLMEAIPPEESVNLPSELASCLDVLPDRPTRRELNIYLDHIAAASVLINRRNLEHFWRMLIQRWLDELIERVDNRMFSVRPEHDVWHDNSAPPVPATETAASSGETSGVYEFLVGSDADKTLHVKREDLRTCRPDLLVLCRMLIREQPPGRRYVLVDHAIPLIMELKKAPTREKAHMMPGDVLSEDGERLTDSGIAKASEQVVHQGALYLRTPAGLAQSRVRVVAVCGCYAKWADMVRTGPHCNLTSKALWERLSNLKDADMLEQSRDAAIYQFNLHNMETRLMKKNVKEGKPARPHEMQHGADFVEKWSERMHIYSNEFQNMIHECMVDFVKEHNIPDVRHTDEISLQMSPA